MKMLTAIIGVMALLVAGCATPESDSDADLYSGYLYSDVLENPDYSDYEDIEDVFTGGEELPEKVPYDGTDQSIPERVDSTMYDHEMMEIKNAFRYNGPEFAYENTLRSSTLKPIVHVVDPSNPNLCRAGYTEHWLNEYVTHEFGPAGPTGELKYPGDALFVQIGYQDGRVSEFPSSEFRLDFRGSQVPSHFIFRFMVDGEPVAAVTGTQSIELEPNSRSFQGDWISLLGADEPPYYDSSHYPEIQIQGVSVCM